MYGITLEARSPPPTLPPVTDHTFHPSREAALAALSEFVPRAGRTYAEGRNFDHGPGRRDAVSQLSPYLRHRVITEEDVLRAVLDRHTPDAASRFVTEVFWRTYWKGWLEMRPSVWTAYRAGLGRAWNDVQTQSGLRGRWEDACAGETGIDCFDAWARELAETGYLHNHARMWFASIWIFTLGLPWRLGADFFLRHLLDGDPASNTCSWRWVAGLHTRGKHYEAQAANISRFTRGRVTLPEERLAQDTDPLDAPLPERQPLRQIAPPREGVPTLLLLTEEDCLIPDFAPERLDLRAVLCLRASRLRSPGQVAARVCEVEETALADSVARLGLAAEWRDAGDPAELARHAQAAGAVQVVTPYIPTGPLRDWIAAATPSLEAAGIALAEWQRGWDALVWPHATAGFFKLRKRMPRILHEAGLA